MAMKNSGLVITCDYVNTKLFQEQPLLGLEVHRQELERIKEGQTFCTTLSTFVEKEGNSAVYALMTSNQSERQRVKPVYMDHQENIAVNDVRLIDGFRRDTMLHANQVVFVVWCR